MIRETNSATLCPETNDTTPLKPKAKIIRTNHFTPISPGGVISIFQPSGHGALAGSGSAKLMLDLSVYFHIWY